MLPTHGRTHACMSVVNIITGQSYRTVTLDLALKDLFTKTLQDFQASTQLT